MDATFYVLTARLLTGKIHCFNILGADGLTAKQLFDFVQASIPELECVWYDLTFSARIVYYGDTPTAILNVYEVK